MTIRSLLEHVGLNLTGRTVSVGSRQADPPAQGPAMPSQLTIPAVESLVGRARRSLPTLGDFAHATVQAFDQSLSNTGMAIVKATPTGLYVLATAMIRPPADVQGLKAYEGNLAKADAIYAGVARHRSGLAASADAVVYERPPVSGKRTESILMAGREVHRATHGHAVIVDNRHAKAVIVGRAGTRQNPVTKAHVKEAVERLVSPPADRGLNAPWNEHTRDAVLLALTWLYDEKQRRDLEAAA